MAGRSAWRCKVIADNMLRRCRPPPTPCFRWRCGGGRSRPPALAGGVANWQSGQANGLECVLLPRNCPLVNCPNEKMSAKPITRERYTDTNVSETDSCGCDCRPAECRQ